MIDCQQVNELLPLWIGQDLPDVTSAATVANHLKTCKNCEEQHKSLQASLDILQASSSKTLPMESVRPSMWPQLSVRISEWDKRQNRQRFHDWLPASVMTLAVTLMIAVSIPSMYQEFFGEESYTLIDQFTVNPLFQANSDEVRPIEPMPTVQTVGKPLKRHDSEQHPIVQRYFPPPRSRYLW